MLCTDNIYNSYVKAIREKNPLIHNISNDVVANFKANGLLAIGASPLMAKLEDEMHDISKIEDALVINMGTPDKDFQDAAVRAARSANIRKTPIVLDPVGVGIGFARRTIFEEIVKHSQLSLIRCNLGELAAINEVEWNQSGVDCGDGKMDIEVNIKRASIENDCIIAVTGKEDIVCYKNRIEYIQGGHELITSVTGSGCLLSAVCGAFLSVVEDQDNFSKKFEAVCAAMKFYKDCSEKAVKISKGCGDLVPNFINTLFAESGGKIE